MYVQVGMYVHDTRAAVGKEPEDTIRTFSEHIGHVSVILGQKSMEHKQYEEAIRIYEEALGAHSGRANA